LANKGSPTNKGSQQNISSFNKIPDDSSSRFRQSDFNMMRPHNAQLEKKGSLVGAGNKKYMWVEVEKT